MLPPYSGPDPGTAQGRMVLPRPLRPQRLALWASGIKNRACRAERFAPLLVDGEGSQSPEKPS